MRITIKSLKNKRNEVFDIEISNRLSKFIEKQNLLDLINTFDKIAEKIISIDKT